MAALLKENSASATMLSTSMDAIIRPHSSEIDAKTISIDTLGKYFPNTPMLAAVVKVSNIMDENVFLEDMEKSFAHKFAKKPEVIPGNMEALKRSLNEVKGL